MIDSAAQLTVASAPWWVVAVVSGGLSIVAGAVGGLISFWSLRKSDDRHAGREELAYQRRIDERWDEDVLRGAKHFVLTTRKLGRAYRELEKRLLALYGPPPYPTKITSRFLVVNTHGTSLMAWKVLPQNYAAFKQRKACAAVEVECDTAVTELVMVAPDSIVRQCRAVLKAALAHAEAFLTGDDRTALEKKHDEESVKLHRIGREELRTRRDLDDPAF